MIRQSGVEELFIFNDGPRAGNEEDANARVAIKKLIETTDLRCRVSVNFSEVNLGCGAAVSSAISWAFEQVDMLIVLEDDCVPVLPFFEFCDDMLERYKDDSRVWMVSGNNYNEEYAIKNSYIFSHNAIHIYGWSTWKRCCKEYDLQMGSWPAFYKANGFARLFSTEKEIRFWTNKYAKLYEDRIKVARDTWDFQLLLTLFVNGGLVIVPKKNLVTNIGYSGAHNSSKNHSHDKRVDPDFRVTSHPGFVLADRGYDYYHWKNCWMKKAPVIKRIRKKISQLFKNNPG
jgi:hypothetical protein